MSVKARLLKTANRQCLSKLFGYARRYRGQFLLGSLLGLVASGAECGQVVVLKHVVEVATSSAPPGEVIRWVGFLTACVTVAILTGAAHNWRMSVTSQRLVLDLQNDVHRKLHTLSEQQIARLSPGEFAHLTLQDTAAAQQAVGLVIGTLLRQPATALALACYLIYLDWQIATLALIGYALILLFVRLLTRGLQQHARRLQEIKAAIHQRFLNLLAGRDLLRCFDTSGQLVESLPQANDDFHATASRYIAKKCTVTPLGRMAAVIFAIALVCCAAWQLRDGRISAGTAAAIAASLIAFYRPISRLAGFSAMLAESLASAQRVFDFLSEHSYWQSPESQPSPALIWRIEFSNVHLAFADRDFNLQAINFQLEAGQVALLTGSSGSGKSTLIKLLASSLQPAKGTLLVNDIPLAGFSRQRLHHQLAYLPQDCPVLGRTIREEITLGRPNVRLVEIEEAARNAEVLDWIQNLPDGLETPVGPSGMCISGGQQQRLALARAFLANRSLYLLDEPTAHLDHANEHQIMERLCRHIRERNAIGLIVSHRLALAQQVDRVLELRDGTVVELPRIDPERTPDDPRTQSHPILTALDLQ